MENLTLQQLISQTQDALSLTGASNYYQKVYKTLSKQLLIYAEEHNTDSFSMDFGLQFLEDHYQPYQRVLQRNTRVSGRIGLQSDHRPFTHG